MYFVHIYKLYQTIRRDPCLYGALKHKCTVPGVVMCGKFGLSCNEFSSVRKRARAASAKANEQLGCSSWTMAKEVQLAAVVSAVEDSVDHATMKATFFWQRVSTKFCDPDLRWTITAKTAQMRSFQRAKHIAKRGSTVDDISGQEDTDSGAWTMVESNRVLADSRVTETRRVLDAPNLAGLNNLGVLTILRASDTNIATVAVRIESISGE